eukprot:scaffold36310_cov118-Isochrysis_galbana.AAC.5
MEVQRQQVHNRALSSQLAEAAAALREADSRVRSAARTRHCASACPRSDLSLHPPSIGGCAAGAVATARGAPREPALRILQGADAARLLRSTERHASVACPACNRDLLSTSGVLRRLGWSTWVPPPRS